MKRSSRAVLTTKRKRRADVYDDDDKLERRKKQKRDYATRRREQDKKIIGVLDTENKELALQRYHQKNQINQLKSWVNYAKSYLSLVYQVHVCTPCTSGRVTSDGGPSPHMTSENGCCSASMTSRGRCYSPLGSDEDPDSPASKFAAGSSLAYPTTLDLPPSPVPHADPEGESAVLHILQDHCSTDITDQCSFVYDVCGRWDSTENLRLFEVTAVAQQSWAQVVPGSSPAEVTHRTSTWSLGSLHSDGSCSDDACTATDREHVFACH